MPKKKRKKKNQKQIKGFTLIELLAVITILGILMLVAIPNITRTIENSRKDTFVNVAKAYINAVKTEVASNSIQCCNQGEDCESDPSLWTDLAVCDDPNDEYWFFLSTADGSDWYQQTKNIMESGGKSSWGNKDLTGFVVISDHDYNSESGEKTDHYSYSILLFDDSDHGVDSTEEDLDSRGRDSLETTGDVRTTYESNTDGGYYPDGACTCKLA